MTMMSYEEAQKELELAMLEEKETLTRLAKIEEESSRIAEEEAEKARIAAEKAETVAATQRALEKARQEQEELDLEIQLLLLKKKNAQLAEQEFQQEQQKRTKSIVQIDLKRDELRAELEKAEKEKEETSTRLQSVRIKADEAKKLKEQQQLEAERKAAEIAKKKAAMPPIPARLPDRPELPPLPPQQQVAKLSTAAQEEDLLPPASPLTPASESAGGERKSLMDALKGGKGSAQLKKVLTSDSDTVGSPRSEAASSVASSPSMGNPLMNKLVATLESRRTTMNQDDGSDDEWEE